MPHCLSVKETMLRCSIYPALFYGYESKPPAANVFLQIRAAAARALLGPSKSLSSVLALSLTRNGILDPEYWLTLRALSLARDFLLRSGPAVVIQFLYIASRFRGSLHQLKRPASALPFLLCNIGWQITSEGVLHVSAFRSFSLVGVSLQRIRGHLTLSWQVQLVRTHTARESWYHFPDIDLLSTVKTLLKFNDGLRKNMTKELSGGCQLASQKQHWLDSSDGTCQFCQPPDTRTHRLMTCPIGAEVREPFMNVWRSLAESGDCMLEFPFVMVHPHLEALHLMH